jgi:hypothetical protein
MEERNREIQVWAKAQLARNRAVLEQFTARIQAESAAGRWGYGTDMSVQPGLVKRGERVAIGFRVAGALPAPCDARVEPDFLSAAPGKAEPLSLNWKPAADGGSLARVELTATRPGNWRVVWRAGQEELSRIFAVVEPGYAVCRMLVTTHPGLWKPGHAPEAYTVIHDYGLAADFWEGAEWVSPYSRSPEDLLQHFRVFRDMQHATGDRVLPLCNANWLIPGCPDTNLWRLDNDVQREGLQLVGRLWESLGLGRMEIFGSYTFGHSTPRIARDRKSVV